MDKYAEALEIEYLVEELVETYSRALPQVQASRQTADSQFQGVLLSEITKFKKSLEAKELRAIRNEVEQSVEGRQGDGAGESR